MKELLSQFLDITNKPEKRIEVKAYILNQLKAMSDAEEILQVLLEVDENLRTEKKEEVRFKIK